MYVVWFPLTFPSMHIGNDGSGRIGVSNRQVRAYLLSPAVRKPPTPTWTEAPRRQIAVLIPGATSDVGRQADGHGHDPHSGPRRCRC